MSSESNDAANGIRRDIQKVIVEAQANGKSLRQIVEILNRVVDDWRRSTVSLPMTEAEAEASLISFNRHVDDVLSIAYSETCWFDQENVDVFVPQKRVLHQKPREGPNP